MNFSIESLYEAICFVASILVADSYIQNRQILVAASRYRPVKQAYVLRQMKHIDTIFEEFTRIYIRNFPDKFRHLKTPVQIYTLENLSSNKIATPTPLPKADFNFIVFTTNDNFKQQVGNEIKKVSANQALLVVQGIITLFYACL